MTVYLWDAATWSGVSGSLEDAQRHVTARLSEKTHGRIEAALLVTGVWSLSFCYERTGPTWTVGCHQGGTVLFDPGPHEHVPVAS